MAVAHFNYFNQPLQKQAAFAALLPDRCEPGTRYPVYYLLHGLSDDYTAWMRWTSIERYVRSLPLIVVFPDGDRSWYCDHAGGPQYESSIIKGLIPFVEAYLPAIPERSGRVIGGLSMGGYGSMKLALKFPQMFCSVAGHSGAYAVSGNEDIPVTKDDCPFALAEAIDTALAPAIRFDCGVDDFLLDHNRGFDEHLTKLGIAHEYQEFPGDHNWGYWDVHVQEAIAFHCRALGIEA